MSALAALSAALLAALSWLGRQGTRAVAISVFLGVALPQLAAVLKPFISEAVFVLLFIAFLRVEPAALRGHFTRPGAVVAITVWMMLAVPVLSGAALMALGLQAWMPGLFIALVLQSAAPPVVSTPIFAALLGLDAALALAALITCTALTPLTAPLLAALFLGQDMAISPLALGARLFGLLLGAGVLAWLARRLVGREFLTRYTDPIDGVSVIMLFLFAVALMDGMLANLLQRPLFVAALTALAFAISAVMVVVTTALFWRLGPSRAMALGISTGIRNLALMLAGTGGTVPELTWLYFAVGQFPIYLMPHFLKPLVAKVGAAARARASRQPPR